MPHFGGEWCRAGETNDRDSLVPFLGDVEPIPPGLGYTLTRERMKVTSDPMPVILVADDSRLVTELFKRVLQQRGYRVITTATGTEALEIGLTQDLDLAIMDQVMPGRVGAEVLQAWRAAGRDMPVIMVSAIEEPRMREQAIQLGASFYLYKPISSDELLSAVERLLGPNGGAATQ